jgi:hypothetical protein
MRSGLRDEWWSCHGRRLHPRDEQHLRPGDVEAPAAEGGPRGPMSVCGIYPSTSKSDAAATDSLS